MLHKEIVRKAIRNNLSVYIKSQPGIGTYASLNELAHEEGLKVITHEDTRSDDSLRVISMYDCPIDQLIRLFIDEQPCIIVNDLCPSGLLDLPNWILLRALNIDLT